MSIQPAGKLHIRVNQDTIPIKVITQHLIMLFAKEENNKHKEKTQVTNIKMMSFILNT